VPSWLKDWIVQTKSELKVFGFQSLLSKGYRFIGMRIFGDSFYQAPLIACIESLAPLCKTFIDIGAGRGTITTAVWNLFDECIAIEPSSSRVKQLKRNLAAAGNCVVIQRALSSRVQNAVFYQSRSNTDDAGLFLRDDLVATDIICVSTLDDITKGDTLATPYLIKIDVQGSELDVLMGGIETAEVTGAILTEFWPYGIASTGRKPIEYLRFITQLGFRIYDIKGRLVPDQILARICSLGERNRFVTTDLLCMRSKSS